MVVNRVDTNHRTIGNNSTMYCVNTATIITYTMEKYHYEEYYLVL
jgi:hypothetical protein